MSNEFSIKTSLRQGDKLSSIIVNFVFESVIASKENTKRLHRSEIEGKNTVMAADADDVIIISETGDQMRNTENTVEPQ